MFTTALILASLLYALGGVSMKYSNGYQAWLPTCLVFVCFGLAAGVQTWAMKYGELGRIYMLILGLEGILAVIGGCVFFGESISLHRGVGIVLILAGLYCME